MSTAVASFLASLYDNEDKSDCTIVFGLRQATDTAAASSVRPAKKQKGDGFEELGRMPGHLLTLVGGSKYFLELSNQAAQQPGSKGKSAKPELRVELRKPEEQAMAPLAVRFMYTGKLGDDATSSLSTLLGVRRLAVYLQVGGCAEAIDTNLMARLPPPEPRKPFASPSSPTPVLIPILGEIYKARQLLPARGDDPGAPALLDRVFEVGRSQLLDHWSKTSVPNHPGVSLTDLLVWIFPDAPGVLSDPEARKAMCQLPTEALEALLKSNAFATDSEDSVLLLLATWKSAVRYVSPSTLNSLCFAVRLRHLSPVYLHAVLPYLPWFPIDTEQHGFICQLAGLKDEQARALLRGTGLRVSASWGRHPPRPLPQPGSGGPAAWSVSAEDVLRLKPSWALPNSSDPVAVNGGEQLVFSLSIKVPEELQLRSPHPLRGVAQHDLAGLRVSRSGGPDLVASLTPSVACVGSPGTSCSLALPPAGPAAPPMPAAGAGATVPRGPAAATAPAIKQEQVASSVTPGVAAAVAVAATPPPPKPADVSPEARRRRILATWAPYLRDGRFSVAMVMA
ncbi:hypothetical protein HYH03_007070 [Edaphochlamys debaryana]|uniref:BACK domain-containing protein n=1 Tax=Edaphochlamys debaryana TaxID=47281 RepID=A0A836C0U0_9CHLO|nr:hypothetical protein HYH03_007070 [Edaphochlamys debaryana]|eukprot:KAG2494829.1 hypothetical protein HYH03_007070 [Edaphochlamys debaryana]